MAAIIAVDDVHKTYEELVAKGVEFTEEPTERSTAPTVGCATRSATRSGSGPRRRARSRCRGRPSSRMRTGPDLTNDDKGATWAPPRSQRGAPTRSACRVSRDWISLHEAHLRSIRPRATPPTASPSAPALGRRRRASRGTAGRSRSPHRAGARVVGGERKRDRPEPAQQVAHQTCLRLDRGRGVERVTRP